MSYHIPNANTEEDALLHYPYRNTLSSPAPLTEEDDV